MTDTNTSQLKINLIYFLIYLHYSKIVLSLLGQIEKKMKTTIEQCNYYNLTKSNGQNSEIYICASNIKEATQIAKRDYPNEFYFGKLKRAYNGGVRG